MKETFQDGVDSIYDAIKGQGTTPGGKSPADLVSAIGTMATNKYNAGAATGRKVATGSATSPGDTDTGVYFDVYVGFQPTFIAFFSNYSVVIHGYAGNMAYHTSPDHSSRFGGFDHAAPNGTGFRAWTLCAPETIYWVAIK